MESEDKNIDIIAKMTSHAHTHTQFNEGNEEFIALG